MEKKTYKEWIDELEEEYGHIIIDDDGGRSLHREGRYNEKLSKAEARKYFLQCTVMRVREVN